MSACYCEQCSPTPKPSYTRAFMEACLKRHREKQRFATPVKHRKPTARSEPAPVEWWREGE